MKILKELELDNLLFIDIETVNAVKQLELGTALYEAWDYKNKFGRDPLKNDDIVASYKEQAALYPEFGKVVCITIGKIKDGVLKLKSYVGDNETQVLADFSTALINIIAANKKTALCGHAIKGFDIPWLMRRMIVNQVALPSLLDTAHLKPWELTCYDTMDLWKGTAFNGASLIAIAAALGLHNPKDELAGWQTNEAYYGDPENGLARIQAYCEKDVLTVANIVLKCRYEPIVEAEAGDIKVKKVGVLNKAFNNGELIKEDEKHLMANFNKLNEAERGPAKEIMAIVNKK